MGMFDSFYDAQNEEWQTKAFDCELAVFRAGDKAPDVGVTDYQVEIYNFRRQVWSETFATVRDGVVEQVDTPRDPSLPLLAGHGGWISNGTGSP